jgi:nucleoside-diphosphate kinase
MLQRRRNCFMFVERFCDLVQRTLVMIKPDGIGRRLCGDVIRRYESKGLKLVGLKFQVLTRELAERQYGEHRHKPFYDPLVAFMTSGPSLQMVWEGEEAVAVVRKINGATNSLDADIGSIRGDYGLTVRHNIVHASDSPETAEREIGLYFQAGELLNYTMPDAQWLTT